MTCSKQPEVTHSLTSCHCLRTCTAPKSKRGRPTVTLPAAICILGLLLAAAQMIIVVHNAHVGNAHGA